MKTIILMYLILGIIISIVVRKAAGEPVEIRELIIECLVWPVYIFTFVVILLAYISIVVDKILKTKL